GMISRHHAVMRLDTRRTVYLLPLTMVFVLFAGATLALIAQRGRLSRGKMQLILLVLLTSSVVSVVSDTVFRRGDAFTKVLLISLKDPNAPELANVSDHARLQREAMSSPIYK